MEVVPSPNPACSPYFGRTGERGKQALRGLQEGLRKLTTMPPSSRPSSAASNSTGNLSGLLPFMPRAPQHLSTGRPVHLPTGVSMYLLAEVACHVPEGFTTRDVVAHLVIPLVRPPRQSMCELSSLFPRKQMAPATLYTIHAWDAPFQDTMRLLQQHVRDRESSVSLFVDFLCANLFSKETVPERVRTTRIDLKNVDNVLIVLTSAEALSRTWIQYQLWVLVREHREDAVTLMLGEGVTLSSLRLKAASISLRHSVAVQEEKDAILAEVFGHYTSAESFNAEVCKFVLSLLRKVEEAQAEPPSAPAAPSAQLVDESELPSRVAAAAAAKAAPIAPSTPVAAHSKLGHAASVPQDGVPVLEGAGVLQCLKKLHKVVFVNAERLTGMIAQFDYDDKDFLVQSELEEFIEFFVDEQTPEDCKAVAAALCKVAGDGRLTFDNFHDSVKALMEKNKRQRQPSVPAPSDSRADEAEGGLPSLGAVVAKKMEAAEPSPDLGVLTTPTAVACMKKLHKVVFVNAERLTGMIAQFDEGEKDYLVQSEMVEFIDFFVDEQQREDCEAVADALCSVAEGGKLTFDNFHAVVKLVNEKNKRRKTAPAPEPSSSRADEEGGLPSLGAVVAKKMEDEEASSASRDNEAASEAKATPAPAAFGEASEVAAADDEEAYDAEEFSEEF